MTPPDDSARQRRAWSEADVREILDSAPDATILSDVDGEIVHVNRQTEKLFGYRRDELLGQAIEILVPERFRDGHVGHRTRYSSSPEARPMGATLSLLARRKDGSEFPVEISLSPIRTPGGLIVSSSIRDVTERARIQEELQLAHSRLEEHVEARTAELRSIVQTANIAILLLSPELEILEWNAEAERMFGRPLHEALGMRFVDAFIPPRAQDSIRAEIRHVIAGHESRGYECPALCADGSERIVRWNSTRLGGRGDTVIGIIACGEDITGLKQVDEERERLRREAQQHARLAEIGAIVAKVVHDVGNCVAGISMQGQLIVRRAQQQKPVESILQAAQMIVSESSRLTMMVQDFRAFSREQRLDLKEVDLREFLESVVKVWEPQAEPQGIRVQVDVPEEAVVVRVDQGKLHRVLDNLFKNALEAIESGPGEVRIRLTPRRDDHVRISIADTGPGISDSIELFRLFESTKPNGTGLGLAVCKQIVDAHDGKIEAESLAPHGTVIHVDLPISGPA